ncbi:putative actin-binding protein Fragmin [Durotheca rogersii]|uniref:putative actin-binding protein Fragmin n=1 Tax=Durotheca rogersii TaxID=419775 RepID=UPI0022208DA8|nr:putative actin-binding protein Fragmin [Durotheca rogersii]KAI5854483.1 putative actin-binding protein Fragmin [Durotheca rogersii]
MAPREGLVHLKEYDWRDSNVENIGTEFDHQVKYNSAASEPAWREVGLAPGLYVWRVENFEVVPWPKDQYGDFYEGDSYIILYSYKAGGGDGEDKLAHEIFFWLGSQTTQDEAGTAAYKTVELDEFLHGVATQHRELQREPSDEFVALFPRIRILSGGVRSGFTHVETEEPDKALVLLRIFKHPAATRVDSVMVCEVEPAWQSLDENDVFVLERDDKIWVWQGKNCSPMEKAKAAQVVHDMTLAKHLNVEVLSQNESRSRAIVAVLGGEDVEGPFRAPRPIFSFRTQGAAGRTRKLFRLSDASGQLRFYTVKEGAGMSSADLDSNDVFLLDTGDAIWVWQGSGASGVERAAWIRVAESYIRQLADESEEEGSAYLSPISRVVEGNESRAFTQALEV